MLAKDGVVLWYNLTMEIKTVSKKHLIILGLILIAIGAIAIAGFWRYRKNLWLIHKQQTENQKAEEITIRIIEGWSNKEIGEYLQKQGIINEADFLNKIKSFDTAEYRSFLPEEAKGALQGFLYPDTYRLYKSVADRSKTSEDEAAGQIIAKLLDNFQKKLPSDASGLAKKQGLNLYQTITLASMVENETGRNIASAEDRKQLEQERKIVAGIFYNRLRANMALQSDATINYITGKRDPSPELEDLKIKSPYNTYINRGLPPTPIGNPSLSSINSVLNPIKTDYFYFLHKQPSGEPVYSKTFDEHVKNKQRYLK